MPRRSKEELLAEFHRLSDVFDILVDLLETLPWNKNIRENIRTREHCLDRFERKETTLSQLIAGVREAINDFNEDYLLDDETVRDRFLAYYKSRTGRDYYDDAGHPRKLARAIFRRGKIQDETEWRMLTGIMNNLDQTVFKDSEIDRVNAMLDTFEFST